jgi:hypothetical protein
MNIQKDSYVGYGTTNPQTIIHLVQSNVSLRLEDPRDDIYSSANIEFKRGSSEVGNWKLSSSNSFFNIASVSNNNSSNILSINSKGNIIVANDILIGGNFVKSGENIDITKIHASNITAGALLVERGGTGLNILQPSQLIVGNGTNPPIQSPNLSWNNTTSILVASNIVARTIAGVGSNITRINADYITDGTLLVNRGGTGLNILQPDQLIVGNGTNPPIQSPNLFWNNATSILVASNIVARTIAGVGSNITRINAEYITDGTLLVERGGTGLNILQPDQLIVGNGTNPPIQSPNLFWNNATSILVASNIVARTIAGVGSNITRINADYISDGTINSLRLPIASSSVLGAVKKGNNIDFGGDGTISVNLSTYNADVGINGNLVVNSNLIVHGATTTLNTDVFTTERLELTNAGSSTSFLLSQTSPSNANNILNVINSATSNVFNISSAGNVGIGVTNPTNRLDIQGSVAQTLRIMDTRTAGDAIIALKELNDSNGFDMAYIGTTGDRFYIRGYNNSLTPRVDFAIDRATGNVGIGTSNPTSGYLLDVNGSSIIRNNLLVGSTTNSSSDDNISFVIPDAKLYVRGDNIASSTTNIVFRGGLQGNNNGKVRIWLASDASHSSYIESEHTSSGNTQLTFGTANGNNLPAERMRITNSGNVGIGTTAPNANLHLHSAAASQNVRISFTDNTSGVSTNDGFCIGKDAQQVGYIYNIESNALSFGTNNTERLRIASDGTISTTNNINAGSATITGGAINCSSISNTGNWTWAPNTNYLLNASANTQEWSFDLMNQNTYTGCYWQIWSDKTGLGSILACRGDNGYVGIGITNPTTAKLVIAGTSGNTGLDMATYNQISEMRVIRNSLSSIDKNLYLNQQAGATSSTYIYSDNTETIRCSGTNVGINKAPSHKLDVNGNVNISSGSTYKINGTDLAFSNLIGIVPSISLPIAGSGVQGVIGGIKVDGSSITVDMSGIISASSASGSKWALSDSSNIYKMDGNVGIGINGNIDEKLLVNGNVKITNGFLLTCNIITNTLNAVTISGVGSNITRINADYISDGTLLVNRGGTGLNILQPDQLIVGNGTNPPIQSPNLSWNNATSILVASNIVARTIAGVGSNITRINADYISDGTLLVNRGGTGLNILQPDQLIVGNGTNPPIQSPNLSWNNATSILVASNIVARTIAGVGSNITRINADYITDGTINSLRLPIASSSVLGAVKKGNNIDFSGDGTISVNLSTYNADVGINGNLVVNSNLIVHGTSTTLNTDIYTTERLEVTNAGPGISFTLKQTSIANANNILSVSNYNNTEVFNIKNNGDINFQSNINSITKQQFSKIANIDINDSNVSNYVSTTSISLKSQIDTNNVWLTNTPHIYNKNTGNVGIGTTNPLKKLHILQIHNIGGTIDTAGVDITEADVIVSSMSLPASRKDAGIIFMASGAGGSTNISVPSSFIKSGWTTAGSTAWNKSYIDFNTHGTNTTSWTTDMRIQGGNVGIGTTNPTQLLTLNNGNILLTGTWNSSSKYNIQCINTDKRIEFDNTNGTGIFDNAKITFNVNNQQVINIVSNGNVGIGKTANYKLDVNGDVNATDFRINTISLNTTISTNNTNSSNYVSITSNILVTDYIARNALLNTKVDTNNTNASNYVSTTSNILVTDYIARNALLNTKVDTNNTNASNYVSITSNILVTDYIARNALLNTKVDTNNTNASNYVSITSNILVTDYIARNALLNTKVDDNIVWTKNGSNIYKNNTGNVGIGTTNPTSAKLVISGNNGENGLDMSTSDQYANMRVIRNSLSPIDKDLYLQIGAGAGSKLKLYSNNVETMIISNGSVGIGTTNPNALLHIEKFISPATTLDLFNVSLDVNWGLRIQQSYTGVGNIQYNLIHKYNNVDYNSITFKSANVGIGTNNPNYKLDVNGNVYAGNNSYLLSTYDSIGGSQYFGKQYLGGIIAGMEIENTTLGGNWAQKLHFHSHAYGGGFGRRLTIAENGNVCIGTTTSVHKLDVSGNVNISAGSTYKINGQDLAFSNLIGIIPSSNLPFAGSGVSGVLGAVKVDGSSITITPSGVISASSASGSKWALSDSSNIYKMDGNVGIGVNGNIDEKLLVNGNLKITNGFLLTCNIITNTLNAVSISGAGSNITNINANNITLGTINNARLPVATSGVIGAVKKGNNINIAGDGTISVDLASYTGDASINGNLVVNSNLIVHGTSTTLNTDVYTTERLEITNSGTTNSTLTIRQTASGNTNSILNIIGSASTTVFNISNTGAVSTNNNNINAGTGTITATTFSGALSGNATTATNASGLIGTPNINVGTISCSSITGSGQTNQITNNTDGGVGLNIRNNSSGASAFTYFGVLNSLGSSFVMFLNSSTRTNDGGVNTATLRNDAGDLRLAAASSSPFIYLKSSNGNIGIGTTNPTTAKLVISGTAGLTGLDMATNDQYAEMRVIRNSLSTIDKDLYLNFDAGANSKTRIFSNNVETIRVSGGNVGIGMTNPQRPLCIYTPNATGALKLLGGTGASGDNWWLGFCHSSNPLDSDDRARIGISIEPGGAGNLYFTTGGTGTQVERMRISSNGNVGIGKTANYMLDVNGDVNAADFRINNVSLNTTITTNNTNISNYVNITSNNIFADYILRDSALDTKINTNNTNVSNYVSTASNLLINNIQTSFYTKNEINNCNYVKIDSITSNFWKNIKSTQKNTIYYGAPVKIGGSNSIDVADNYILEILGNVRIKGTITQGWIGDGSTSGDGGILAPAIFGSGSDITNLNANNITLGTLPVIRGGTGTSSFVSNQILLGGSNSIISSSNLLWDNVTNTLNTSNINALTIRGIGSNITNINADNITSGTLPVTRGGIGAASITSSQLLVGAGTNPVASYSGLTWITATNTLNASSISGAGSNITNINANNITLGTINSLLLPTASTSVLGGVKVDGTTITINGSGVISGANIYVLPTASTSVLGGVKVDGTTITINGSGVISGANTYVLPTATASVLGGVKKGNNINIAGDGTISVDLVSYTGDTSINGNLVVNSNLIVHGATTTLNTDVYTTERLEITYGGIASSTFSVRQTASGNTNNILNVINSATSNVFNVSNTGNVGIGTTNPANKLDIQGSSVQTLRIMDTRATGDAIIALKETNDNNGFDMAYIGTTGDRFYIRGYNNSATPRVDFAIDRITSNVGIGVTNPRYKLHISGTNPILSINGQGSAGAKSQINLSTYEEGVNAPTCSLIATDDGNFSSSFQINLKTVGSITNSQFTAFQINTSGNIGIGTTNPFSSLHIHKNAVTQDVRIILSDNTSTASTIRGLHLIKYSDNISYLWNYENTPLIFGTNALERTRIDSNGNVGIGTNAPQTTLDVNGNLLIRAYGTTGSGTRGIFFRPDFVTTNQYNCSILTYDHGGGGTTDGLSINGFDGVSFCTGSGTRTERMLIAGDGSVLIGSSTNSSDDGNVNITTPDSTFYVRGARTAGATTNISFRGGLEGQSGGKVRIWMSSDAAHSSYIESHHTGSGNTQLIFGTANGNATPAERMRIANDGSVGIGNTNPQRPLCVYTPNATGGLKLTGGTNLGGDSWWLGFSHSSTLDSDDRARIGISIASNGAGNLYFTTGIAGSQVERMRIADNGNVGIGTNNPTNKLQINHSSTAANADVGNISLYVFNPTNAANQKSIICNRINGSVSDKVIYSWDVNASHGWSIYTSGNNSAFRINNNWAGEGSDLLVIQQNGNVGIGTTNPSAYKLTVQGDIAASADVIAYYSDERLKDIKEYVKDVLPALSKINVFKYNCNDLAESYGFDKSKNEIGLSAQEIKKYYPELVALAPFDTIRNEGSDKNISKSGEDYLTLKYERLVPVLLQGIKELKQENNLQQKEIDDLKQENNLQQKEIDDLKLRLTRLELLL